MSEWRDYSQPAAPDPASQTAEERRLLQARAGVPWRAWGPYLSERQWGTVREDYSDNGDAWSYFSHDQARSRAYRWGEDGMAGDHVLHGTDTVNPAGEGTKAAVRVRLVVPAWWPG
jgi:hypothetical protein